MSLIKPTSLYSGCPLDVMSRKSILEKRWANIMPTLS